MKIAGEVLKVALRNLHIVPQIISYCIRDLLRVVSTKFPGEK